MTDPKLVITKETWQDLTHDQKLQITYDTAISTRDSIIELSSKVDVLINKPIVCPMEPRIDKLEKHKMIKSIVMFFGSVVGGFGGSHIPK